MRKVLLKEFASILTTLTIKGYHLFLFNGESYPVSNQQPYYKQVLPFAQFGANLPIPNSPEGRNLLINQLSSVLYQHCYCVPFSAVQKPNPQPKTNTPDAQTASLDTGTPMLPDTEFLAQLSLANQTRDDWDYGWTIYSVDAQGQAFAKKNGQLQPLIPNQYRFANATQIQLTPNTPVHIRIKKEDTQVMPGFYFMYSQQVPDHSRGIIRFYWHIQATGTPLLVQLISSYFNQYRIPFWFKCLNRPEFFVQRRDSAVLYLAKPYFKIAASLIRAFYPQIAGQLMPSEPLFSRTLAPGLGFAEDPMDGTSFGQSRCLLLAQAIVSAWEKKQLKKDTILTEIEQVFKDQGLSLDTPYLNPNSFYQYDFEIFNSQNIGATGEKR